MKTPGKQYAYHTSPYSAYKDRLSFAQENRKNPTPAEKLLWERLRGKRLGGFKFRRQHVVRDYIVDFTCLQKLLIIELDGPYHEQGEQPQLDKDRAADLRALGFDIIRFTNEEVLNNIEEVCAMVLECLLKRPYV